MDQDSPTIVVRDDGDATPVVIDPAPLVIVSERPQLIVVNGQPLQPVVVSDQVRSQPVIAPSDKSAVVRMGLAGPQGVPGQNGDLSFTVTAGVDLGYPQVVAIFDGVAHLADPTSVADMTAELAITTQAAAAGNPVTVNITFSLSEPGWNWQPGRMYLGPAVGQISQSPATTGALLEVGRALNATTINFNIRTPIMQ
ncbi:hypothetical protein [Dyella sp.]|uniref:hypothetical protein n=1 Tax=Dyella sp. TaxID=1869338 RepID=UPI002FD99D02